MQYIYRAVVYKPRSEDTAETVIMTPIAGAPHTDQFAVATASGITVGGVVHQPFMNPPRGRRGALDLTSSKTDVGELVIQLLDKRVNGQDNLKRWVTAFAGNVRGRERYKGCRMKIWESSDGGQTWVEYFEGRIRSVSLIGRVGIDIHVHDMSSELTGKIFTGRPHTSITYAGVSYLLPLGMPFQYGEQIEGAPTLRTPFNGTMLAGTGATRTVEGDALSQRDLANLVTETVFKPGETDWGVLKDVRAVIKRLDNNTTGEVLVKTVEFARNGTRWRIKKFVVEQLASTDAKYLSLPTAQTAVTWAFIRDGTTYGTAGLTKLSPLYINDIHPFQLLKDILDGKFSALNPDGTIRRTYKYQTTPLNNLIADPSFKTWRGTIEKEYKIHEFIENEILYPFGGAYRYDVNDQMYVFDIRPPSSVVSCPTLYSSDLAAGTTPPSWASEASTATPRIDGQYILERGLMDEDYYKEGSDEFPAVRTSRIKEFEVPVQILDAGGIIDLEEKSTELKPIGIRAFPGWLNAFNIGGASFTGAGIIAEMRIRERATQLQEQFGRGTMDTTTIHPRTSQYAKSCQAGDYRILQIDELPDPVTWQRGGPRLCRCTERVEDGPRINLSWVDSGLNLTAAVPAITGVALGNDPKRELIVTLAPAGSGEFTEIELHMAVTSTAVGTRPADNSELWVRWTPVTQPTTTITGLRPGVRVWLRARTLAPLFEQRPSIWVYPTPQYKDTTANLWDTPTGLAISAQDPADISRRTLTWTIGANAAEAPVEVFIRPTASPSSDDVLVITLPEGSTRWEFTGLVPGNWTASVRHRDTEGGVSAKETLAFTTSGTPAILPPPVDPAAFSGTPDSVTGVYAPSSEYGIEVTATVWPSSVEVEESVDGGPFVSKGDVPSNQIGRTRWTGFAPNDGLVRTLRARHLATGSTPSEWTAEVSTTPWIPQAPVPATDETGGLNNWREYLDDDGNTVYSWEPGSNVASVWAAWEEFDVPFPPDPWADVAAIVQPLPAGQNTFTVPKPSGKKEIRVQVEPRGSDLSVTGAIRRAIIRAAAPQLPALEVLPLEGDEVGTAYCRFQGRGEDLVSLMAQVKIGSDDPFNWVTCSRGVGDYSYVKERTLEAGEVEHDVRKDPTRFSRLQFRAVLADGSVVTRDPIYFDRNTTPDIILAEGDGAVARVIGDTDTKSIRIQRVDASDSPLGYEYWEDTPGLSINLQEKIGNGSSGSQAVMGAGETWSLLVTAYSEVRVHPDVLTRPKDTEHITVKGGTATPPKWDLTSALAPVVDSKSVRFTLDASATASLTTKVLARYKTGGGGTFTDVGDVTAAVSPALSAPPLSATDYTWNGLPAGFENSGTPGWEGGIPIEVELTFQILSAGAVVASEKRSVTWYYIGTPKPFPPTTPPVPDPVLPPPESVNAWDDVILSRPPLGSKVVTLTLDSATNEGEVRLLMTFDDGYGYSPSVDITDDVTPAVSTPPNLGATYNYTVPNNGVVDYTRVNIGEGILMKVTAQILQGGAVVAQREVTTSWLYTDPRT